MEVVLLSDTHVESRVSALPDWVEETVRAADHVVHAGDFDSRPALVEIESLATGLTAVGGNMDRSLDLSAVESVDLGGVRFVVTRGTGPDSNYEPRVASTVAEHADDGPTVGGVRSHPPGPRYTSRRVSAPQPRERDGCLAGPGGDPDGRHRRRRRVDRRGPTRVGRSLR